MADEGVPLGGEAAVAGDEDGVGRKRGEEQPFVAGAPGEEKGEKQQEDGKSDAACFFHGGEIVPHARARGKGYERPLPHPGLIFGGLLPRLGISYCATRAAASAAPPFTQPHPTRRHPS